MRTTLQTILSAISAAVLILLLVVLLPLSGSSVTLAWDASENATGYKLYWGEESGVYGFSQDVGDVLQADVPIPANSFIAATAYNDNGESGYSDEILYAQLSIQSATGGQIYTAEIIIPVGGMKLGVDYDFQELPNGDIIIIYKHLAPGQRVRLEY